jgi:hypothetical protein
MIINLLIQDWSLERPHQCYPEHCEVCQHCVRTIGVHSSAHHAVDIAYSFGLNVRQGRTKICIEAIIFIRLCGLPLDISDSCMAYTLCCPSVTTLWRDPIVGCFQVKIVYLSLVVVRGKTVLLIVSMKDQSWKSHISYAIAVCPVIKIHNLSYRKWKLAFVNWSSRQWSNKKVTLILPHECLWGNYTRPWPRSRLPFSRSL